MTTILARRPVAAAALTVAVLAGGAWLVASESAPAGPMATQAVAVVLEAPPPQPEPVAEPAIPAAAGPGVTGMASPAPITRPVSVLMMGGAIVLMKTDTKTLQDTATILTSLLGGGLLSIYLIGFFSRRGDARHVLSGIAGTMLFTSWTVLSANGLLPSSSAYPFDLYYTGFVGNVVMFIVVYGLSLVWTENFKKPVPP